MSYETMATARTPALIIYLLDISASMNLLMGDRRRIDIVVDSLESALTQMVFRSTKGTRLSPRYSIAMYAYSDDVYDLLDGIKSVDKVVNLGVPELQTEARTDTAKAFLAAENLLKAEIAAYREGPAPLVCHMTDGMYTGNDPSPIVKRIMSMKVPDGNVLVENIFISEEILPEPILDAAQWPGISKGTKLKGEFAQKLQQISSSLPESYRTMMLECNYHLQKGALMMLPGVNQELVSMGFQMSAATPVR